VAYGSVFVGSGDGNVYALNEHTGAVQWSTGVGNDSASAAVANGVVYLTASDGTLYAFSASTGAILATTVSGFSFLGSPAISDGVLYIGAYTGDTIAFALNAGNNLVPVRPRPDSLRPDFRLRVSQ
jgi:outer membrane protein assembly factor BamB